MDKWNPLAFYHESVVANIFALIVVTIVGVVIGVFYYYQNHNVKPTDEPRKFTIWVDTLIMTIKQMVVDAFGPKFVKTTPYFLFLISFLAVSNTIAMFGLREPTTSYSIPLTLGLITWCSTMFSAIKYQRLHFLKKFLMVYTHKGFWIPYMINPINLIGEITPLISLTFRIWGNIFAGYVIYAILFWAVGMLSETIPAVLIIHVGGGILLPPLMFYFSLFAGILQAYVFTLLSISYISTPINEAEKIKAELELKNNQIQNQKE